MKQLIYIHGWMCFPDTETMCNVLEKREYDPYHPYEERRKWKDWMKEQLKDTHECFFPEMPNKNMASYKVWKMWFEKVFPYLNGEDLIVIGHSLGAMFLIKYIWENTFPKKIKQLHLISSVFDESDMDDDEKYSWDFAYDQKIIPHLESQSEEIFLYHSTDDDIVPYAHTEKIKAYLPKAKLITLTDRGHFFGEVEFPELLANILK